MIVVVACTLAALGGLSEPETPLREFLAEWKKAERLEVEPSPEVDAPKHTITDKKVIQRLASLVNQDAKCAVLDADLANATYIRVKSYAKAADEMQTFEFTINPKFLIFSHKGKIYETKLPSHDLFRRLAAKDFKFPAKSATKDDG